MKAFIITVAGKATRFNQNSKTPVLKCTYTGHGYQNSILERLVRQGSACEKIIIVGGFLFEDLKQYIESRLKRYHEKIELVYNPYFEEKGSMYSLYLGVLKARENGADEILFAEGDLIVDDESFAEVLESGKDVITTNHTAIWADKAVIVYLDENGGIHYVFDGSHHLVRFEGNVKAIFNSGQIWKFRNAGQLGALNEALSEKEKKGANLVLIQKYFADKNYNGIVCVEFSDWCNCNTIKDYQSGMKSVSGRR